MTSPVSRYSKPFKSVPEQVRILTSRGLSVPDERAAEAALRQVGYYRLSGYSFFYRERSGGDRFTTGTCLDDVLELYRADDALRVVMLRGLADVEVALRFHIGHRLGRRDAFAHRLPEHLDPGFTLWRGEDGSLVPSAQSDWVRHYQAQERRSQELFAGHFRATYGPHLPIWASTEVMSLGTLSRLYNGMLENDRKLIAARFGVVNRRGDGDSATFSNWLNLLRHARNICAHHSRLWNRSLDVALALPPNLPVLAHLDEAAARKAYGAAAALRHLLVSVSVGSGWSTDLTAALFAMTMVRDVDPSDFGAPPSWWREMLWGRHSADAEVVTSCDAIDAVETVNRREAVGLLSTRSLDSDRKKWLRYLVAHHAVIEHRVGEQRYYPRFQFADGDVRRDVADVNEMLFAARGRPGRSLADLNTAVQRWWTTPASANGFADAPIDHLMVDSPAVRRAADEPTPTAAVGPARSGGHRLTTRVAASGRRDA
jgi:abortive infection bacteriophage resistance protein